MKMSFYGHFVAGENDDEVKQTTSRLQAHGVGAIREELSKEEAKNLEMQSKCKPRPWFFRQRAIPPAKRIRRSLQKCGLVAVATTDGGFTAIKLTALGRPQFLLQFSEVLMKARELFKLLAGSNKNALHEQKFDFSRFEVWNILWLLVLLI